MLRHLIALLDGEELDSESGLPHIGHIMCNAMFHSYHNWYLTSKKRTESIDTSFVPLGTAIGASDQYK
jgi:hypothetical protein